MTNAGMITRNRRAGWGGIAALVFLVVAMLTGCARTVESDRPAGAEARARSLDVGESVSVSVTADYQWHKVPYLALEQQSFRLDLLSGGDFAPQAVQYRIGSLPNLLTPGRTFRVLMPGQWALRVDQDLSRGFTGAVTVGITRVE